MSRTTIITTCVIALLLFVAGFLCWDQLFLFLIPKTTAVTFQSASPTERLPGKIVFGFTLALIPVAALVLRAIRNYTASVKLTMSVCIIILCMIVSTWLRRELVKFVAWTPDPSIEMVVPVSQLKFEYYAFFGLVAGSVLSYLIVRDKKHVATNG